MRPTRLSDAVRVPAQVATFNAQADALEPRTMLSATPTLVNVDGVAITVSEDGGPKAIARSFNVQDADYAGGGSLTFSAPGVSGSSGTLGLIADPTGRVTISGSDISYQGVVVGQLSPASDSISVDFNQDATLSAVLRIGRLISFEVLGDSPTPATIPVDITFADADPGGPMGVNTTTESLTVTIRAINDQPVVTDAAASGTGLVGEPLLLFPAAQVDDVDSADFGGGYAIVYIDSPSIASPDFEIIDGNGVEAGGTAVLVDGQSVGSFRIDPNRFRVNFNASASPSDVERVVRQISLAGAGGQFGSGTVDLRLLVRDGDGGAGSTTPGSVTFENVAPEIVNIDGRVVSVTAGTGPRRIASTFALSDDDYEQTGAGGSLVVTPLDGEGVISIVDGGGVTTAGGNVFFNGTLVGAQTQGVDGSLTVAFNGDSSVAAVRSVGRRIAYELDFSVGGAEDVSFTFTDAEGLSDTETMTVNQGAGGTPPPSSLLGFGAGSDDESLVLDQLISGL